MTADRYCTYNPTYLDTETVDTTFEVTKGPTQEADGERVFTSNTFANSAKTGDATPIALLAALAVLSASALFAALIATRKWRAGKRAHR